MKIVGFLCAVFGIGCGLPSLPGGPPPLTRDYIRSLFENPLDNEKKLQEGVFEGCVIIPATSWIQRKMVGAEFNGEACSITVLPDNKLNVSFLGELEISVKDAGGGNYQTDIFVGDLNASGAPPEQRVFILQHIDGEAVSFTETIYDSNGLIVYGSQGDGEFIKECHIGRTPDGQEGPANC